MLVLIAQQSKDLGTIGSGGGLGPFAKFLEGVTSPSLVMEKFSSSFSAIIGLLTIIASLYFIFQFITGALGWLSSGGDKQGLTNAQQKITNSFVGLLIIVSALAIIKLLGIFLGFDILDPGKFIENIRFK